MGCSDAGVKNDNNSEFKRKVFDVIKVNEKIDSLYKAYSSIRQILFELKYEEKDKDIFLISKKSIQNYINCIEESKVLDDLDKEIYERLENLIYLINMFDKYELEKNIIIYHDYEEYKRICQNDPENGEFVFVDKIFIENMKINDENIDNKKVKLCIDKKNNSNKIVFPNSNNLIDFVQTKFGFFKLNFDNNNRINPFYQNNYSQYIESSIHNAINRLNLNNNSNNPNIYEGSSINENNQPLNNNLAVDNNILYYSRNN